VYEFNACTVSHFITLELKMGKIALIEYFRVPPRWLFVKITDVAGNTGWGEASLEGHTQAVEGCLDAWITKYTGMEAEYVYTRNIDVEDVGPIESIDAHSIISQRD